MSIAASIVASVVASRELIPERATAPEPALLMIVTPPIVSVPSFEAPIFSVSDEVVNVRAASPSNAVLPVQTET